MCDYSTCHCGVLITVSLVTTKPCRHYIAIYSYVMSCNMHQSACQSVWHVAICNSCNIGMSDLPDMYAQSLRAAHCPLES